MSLVILLVWYFDIISLWTAFIIAIIALVYNEYSLSVANDKIRKLTDEIKKLKDEIKKAED
ncbi:MULTISPECIES: hypothetical protein [unclassified Bartonella]|uniref:hypothetical protein n=1 Tax=unclassified Bartonella TaxID=2645622 RepID=UPI0035CFE0F2